MEIENRIKLCFDLFGKKFFKEHNIIIMTSSDFRDNLNYKEKYEYLCYIKQCLLKIIKQNNDNLIKYNYLLIKLDKIMNKNYNKIQILINDNGVNNVIKKWIKI